MASDNTKVKEGGLRSYAATMMGSALSGILARIPCHPIDTMKAKLQVQTSSSGGYRHVGDALSRVWRAEGLSGLYRGFGTTLIGSAPASCLYFTTYEVSRKRLVESNRFSDYPFIAHFIAGMFAETISCLLWVPIDVIKERQQIQSSPVSAVSIVRQQGFSGLYRGYGATLASFGPFSALYFMFYEQFKAAARSIGQVKPDEALPFPAFLASGAAAGSLASFLTNPLDMAKLRLQVSRAAAAAESGASASASTVESVAATEGKTMAARELNFQYRNFVHGMGEIYRHEGFRGLWRGAGARMMFHAPMTAISITLFEECKRLFEQVL